MQNSQQEVSRVSRKEVSRVTSQGSFAPNPGHWHLIPHWRHYLIARELQLQELQHLTSQTKQSCICKPGWNPFLQARAVTTTPHHCNRGPSLWIHLLLIIPLQRGKAPKGRALTHTSLSPAAGHSQDITKSGQGWFTSYNLTAASSPELSGLLIF